ncbi:hypothetical protein C8039_02720 [Halogeometricum sp. wsp3]|nr:hypothetical protein C8039_02720 [Halogeometricum sp. wsp3]
MNASSGPFGDIGALTAEGQSEDSDESDESTESKADDNKTPNARRRACRSGLETATPPPTRSAWPLSGDGSGQTECTRRRRGGDVEIPHGHIVN